MFDVAVIGAGIVGSMIANELSRYKLKTVVLEKEEDVSLGATRANSAIVHAGFDAKEGSLKALLNVRGSEMMPEVTKRLGVKYKNNGSLVIGFNDEDRKTVEELYKRGVANGVRELKVLNKEELKEIEPNISDNAVCALYAPTGAIICPYEFAMAAIGNAMDNGVELKTEFEVENIVRNDGFFTVKSKNETVDAKYVVNAAGLYSDKIAGMVGDNSFTVTPRKGEYMLLDRECGSLVSHTVFRTPTKMGKGILVSPTVDGNLLLGPTSVDIEDKTDTDTTAAGLESVGIQSREDVDNVMLNKVITSFAGLRAVGSTGDFIINIKDGFVNAAGIESPGLSASPAIAEYVVNLLGENGLILDKKEDFILTRKPMHYFKELSAEEKNKIIKEHPEYGKIVCRCETVTAGEIIEAINTNPRPKDVDGIKRRTRSGMGRCQGGFCMPSVIELIAKEYGIKYEEVKKCGGDSVINFGRTKG